MKTHLKTLFYFTFLLIGLAGTLAACKSASSLPPDTVETTNNSNIITTVRERDTVFQTEKDSSYYKAWIECRDGKPVIKTNPGQKPQSKKGKHLDKPKVDLNDNGELTVECYAASQEYKAKWRDVFTREFIERTSKLTKHVAVKQEPAWWQKALMFLGGAFLAIFIFTLIKKFTR